METISVVVPVYNVAAELGRCVASIVAQSYGNLQIVLVDDGSTDGSGALCDAHARDDARIAVVHKPNGGLSSARNAGLAAATGTWVLYVDADDWIEPDACARLQAAGAAARADVVVGEALWETPAGVRRMAHRALEDGAAISGRDYIVYAVRNRELYVPVWLNLYRRDFWSATTCAASKGWSRRTWSCCRGCSRAPKGWPVRRAPSTTTSTARRPS